MAGILRQKSRTAEEGIKWTKPYLADQKDYICQLGSKARSRGLDPPRILFIGETGSGKSSFISSIVSALMGQIVYTSTVGEKEGAEVNTSKRFLEHRVFLEEKEAESVKLNFILCDSRGIGKKNQQGAADIEIRRLIDGKLQHGDLIDDERGNRDGKEVDARHPKPPSCVVFVQKALSFGTRDPDVQQKLDLAIELVRERGIPSCVVLTHIDKAKESMKSKLHLALTSKTINQLVVSASKKMGVNVNRVFVVKNYVDESRTHTRHDILILRALKGILLDVEQVNKDSFGRKDEESSGLSIDLHARREFQESGYASTEQGFSTCSTYTCPTTLATEDADLLDSASQMVPVSEERKRESPSNRTKYLIPKEFLNSRTGETRASKASFESYRSQKHDYHISTDHPRKKDPNQSSSSDENNYDFEDNDEGFGSASPLVSTSFGPTSSPVSTHFGSTSSPVSTHIGSTSPSVSTQRKNKLQELLANLEQCPYPEKYNTKTKEKGAKVLSRKTVFQVDHLDITSSDSSIKGLCSQLEKEFVKEDYHKNNLDVLQSWSEAEKGAIWLSDTLNIDLGVPLDRPFPDSVDFQVLFLAPDFPAFLLTVFDPERILQGQNINNEEESRRLIEHESIMVEVFCMQMGKLLTSAMLNFCSCDFILVPCTMRSKDFNPSALNEKLEEEMNATRQYFRGPRVLKELVYDQLKAAVTAVAGASYVPELLEKNGSSAAVQDTMILMDRDWRGVVSLLIEKLTRRASQEKPEHVTYPDGGWLKMATAVMEAARRLGYAEEVVVVTDKKTLIQSCKELKRKVMEDTGLSLKLSVVRPSRDVNTSSASYVIIMDLPDFTTNMSTVVLHVLCDKSKISYV